MKKSSFLLLVLSFLLLQSCNKYDANGRLIKEYEELDKAKWLLGDWESKDSIGTLTESWQTLDDSTFVGHSIFITEKKDTIHQETMELMQKENFLVYSSTVKGENRDEATSFQMTESSDSLLVFENPKHNYPKKIRYQLNVNESLLLIVSGTQNGKQSDDTYILKKKL